MKRILIVVAITTILAGIAFWGSGLYQAGRGEVAQPVTLAHQESANNTLVSFEAFQRELASYEGKVVYLDFWASWCTPCRESFPWMNEMQVKYKDKGLKIITVNLDVDRNNAEEFLAQYPAKFEVLFDPKGQVARHYDLPGMPSSIIFNREGKLIERHVGFNKEKQQVYQLQLESLLNE